MFRTISYRVFLMLLTFGLLMSSCKKDEDETKTHTPKVDPTPPGGGGSSEDNSYVVATIKNQYIKDYDTWYYFSFKEGKIIGKGSADPKADDDVAWKERSDWDIAFHRNNVRTNGGLSGNGQAEVMMLETKDFNLVKEVPETGDYTQDTKYNKFMIDPAMPPSFVISTLNKAMNKWSDYDHDKSAWVINLKNIFIVKTADGKYAKIKFMNFLNDADESGYITFKYAYQADGSKVFAK